jgi:hypothetical protein
MGCSILTGIGA